MFLLLSFLEGEQERVKGKGEDKSSRKGRATLRWVKSVEYSGGTPRQYMGGMGRSVKRGGRRVKGEAAQRTGLIVKIVARISEVDNCGRAEMKGRMMGVDI